MVSVILETIFIGIGIICAIGSTLFTINLVRAKQTHTAAICGILTAVLIASLVGCTTLIH